MKVKLLALMFILLVPFAAAAPKTGSMKLLAVSEIGDGVYKGSIADLTLEIREGSGYVFVNTFPISKLDTQISMRFAKQIACRHSGKDCGKYDFIYTLTASTGIVGGPSAGAAAAVLTASLLENLKLKSDVAVTGTINSGELIGPVGGLKEKIDAAAVEGIKKVLIPAGENIQKNDNETVNLSEYSIETGVEIIGVSNLDDAMFYFTGIKAEKQKKELVVDREYTSIMKSLSLMLCERSDELQSEYLSAKPKNNISSSILEFEESAINDTRKAKESSASEDYYTAASYCFRANINYAYLIYYLQDMNKNSIRESASSIGKKIEQMEEETDSRKIETLTDLQAYMIVKERLDEAKDKKNDAVENINTTDVAVYWLAFAQERIYSAVSWSYFFGAEGQEFKLDNTTLSQSCEIKISEAEERYQYVNFYLPSTLSETRSEIDKAKIDRNNGDYIMCLYKASRAKAQANVVLSLIGVENSMLRDIVLQKIDAAEQVIIEEQDMGVFPIMGYSYFEYANSLIDTDTTSSMIYAEYALELSNFDFYFEKKNGIQFPSIDYRMLAVLAVGVGIGLLAGFMIKGRKSRSEKPKHSNHSVSIRVRKARKPVSSRKKQ